MLEPSLDLDSFSYPAMAEEQSINQVEAMISEIHANYGYRISKDLLEMAMYNFDIRYWLLPQYCKDRIDEAFDVI